MFQKIINRHKRKTMKLMYQKIIHFRSCSSMETMRKTLIKFKKYTFFQLIKTNNCDCLDIILNARVESCCSLEQIDNINLNIRQIALECV